MALNHRRYTVVVLLLYGLWWLKNLISTNIALCLQTHLESLCARRTVKKKTQNTFRGNSVCFPSALPVSRTAATTACFCFVNILLQLNRPWSKLRGKKKKNNLSRKVWMHGGVAASSTNMIYGTQALRDKGKRTKPFCKHWRVNIHLAWWMYRLSWEKLFHGRKRWNNMLPVTDWLLLQSEKIAYSVSWVTLWKHPWSFVESKTSGRLDRSNCQFGSCTLLSDREGYRHWQWLIAWFLPFLRLKPD